MKYIEAPDNFIIFCCGKSVLVYENGNTEGRILNLPTNSTAPASEPKAICLRLSPDERYLAVACESKVVHVWCTQTWTLKYTHKLVKRPMSLDIASDSSVLLVADKTGDVYHFPLLGEGEPENASDSGSNNTTREVPKPADENTSEDKNSEDKAESEALLGHLSMLLDLILTDDKRYVITCDRDEKIRISHYPNAYNIEAFCLGHTEFVNQIDILPGKEPLLLSCSGDGTLRLWNYVSGQCMSTANINEHTGPFLYHFEEYCQQKVKDSEEAKRYLPDHPAIKNFSVYSTKDNEIYVAVAVDRIPALYLYKVEEKKFHYVSSTDTKGTVPLVVKWLRSGELIVEQNSSNQPLGVYELQQGILTSLSEHPLISFSQRHKELFIEGKKELCIDILYKQRYNNMADYLKKKQERLETEKAVEAGLMPTVKKGRWV